MDTAKEVVTLIKFALKRGGLLGDIKENLDEQPLSYKMDSASRLLSSYHG